MFSSAECCTIVSTYADVNPRPVRVGLVLFNLKTDIHRFIFFVNLWTIQSLVSWFVSGYWCINSNTLFRTEWLFFTICIKSYICTRKSFLTLELSIKLSPDLFFSHIPCTYLLFIKKFQFSELNLQLIHISIYFVVVKCRYVIF